MTGRVIWAVSSGSYSDYSVLAIFARREDAEAAIAAGFARDSYDPPEIEEFDLYAAGKLPRPFAVTNYHANVGVADGDVIWESNGDSDQWLPARPRITVQVNTMPAFGDRVALHVTGPKGKRTHKAYTDALAKLRAECIEGLHGRPGRWLP